MIRIKRVKSTFNWTIKKPPILGGFFMPETLEKFYVSFILLMGELKDGEGEVGKPNTHLIREGSGLNRRDAVQVRLLPPSWQLCYPFQYENTANYKTITVFKTNKKLRPDSGRNSVFNRPIRICVSFRQLITRPIFGRSLTVGVLGNR